MATYKIPGVHIEEIPKLPPSIASVETAIPAFIGYTQKAQQNQPGDLILIPARIKSMLEYEQFFGLQQPEESIEVVIDTTLPGNSKVNATIKYPSPYLMRYSLQLFFDNGGGPCYIVSVGAYMANKLIDNIDLVNGLEAIKKIDEVTLIVFPDAINLPAADLYYGLYKEALQQCANLLDRFAIMDVWIDSDKTADNIQTFRTADLGNTDILKYGAAYYPRIYTTVNYVYDELLAAVTDIGDTSLSGTLAGLKLKNNVYYQQAKNAIKTIRVLLPVSPAIAGVYAQVDNSRGVWKAPANENISDATGPAVVLTKAQQDALNIDAATGKSINAIRSFAGRGPAIIWGARTLAGNDNEWRYISVRRFFNMVEESVKKATEQFVFEPNDIATWTLVKSMISNYLTQQWKAGALMGTTTREAFFVHAGLGETMTTQDILEGRMIVEIGMAAVRPAEFIILRFMHKMLQEA